MNQALSGSGTRSAITRDCRCTSHKRAVGDSA